SGDFSNQLSPIGKTGPSRSFSGRAEPADEGRLAAMARSLSRRRITRNGFADRLAQRRTEKALAGQDQRRLFKYGSSRRPGFWPSPGWPRGGRGLLGCGNWPGALALQVSV